MMVDMRGQKGNDGVNMERGDAGVFVGTSIDVNVIAEGGEQEQKIKYTSRLDQKIAEFLGRKHKKTSSPSTNRPDAPQREPRKVTFLHGRGRWKERNAFRVCLRNYMLAGLRQDNMTIHLDGRGIFIGRRPAPEFPDYLDTGEFG